MTPQPKIGALAVVIHEGQVLLAQRGKDPGRGLWGFPGGHVEWGETVREAALRELREETAIEARAQSYLTHFDLIHHDDNGQAVVHYLLVGVLCRYQGGTLQAGDDAMDARWFPIDRLRDGTVPVIDRVTELMEIALRAS
ncbi:NUDIX hydrolase [Ruegeria pomeroyi]|nr:NUDIX hydrolase [Ruegeria pomeroyi]